jgi:hypothetical protein
VNLEILKTVLAAGILAAGVGLAAAPAAQAADASCSSKTLKGVYNYAYSGFSVGPGQTRSEFTVAGFGSYDGAGHIRGVSTTVTTGTGAVSALPYHGVYYITPDCQIVEADTDSTGATTHYNEYTGPAGNSVNFVETDSGSYSAGTETRD